MEERKSCEAKSIKIIIKTDDGDIDKFVIKEPFAMVACSMGKKGKNPGKGYVQLVGKKNRILYAYFMLTKKLVKAFGKEMVIKTLAIVFDKELGVFVKKFKEIGDLATLAKMASFGKNNKKPTN